jgi:hypothetical protein
MHKLLVIGCALLCASPAGLAADLPQYSPPPVAMPGPVLVPPPEAYLPPLPPWPWPYVMAPPRGYPPRWGYGAFGVPYRWGTLHGGRHPARR